MDIYTRLAESTVRDYLEKELLPKEAVWPKELLQKKAGCFVSIHKKDTNELRGCIGTINPIHKNLAAEIIANALEAAFHDPRFPAVAISELKNLKYSVDVLGEIEAVQADDLAQELDVKKYGIIVRSKDMTRSGLLLPNLDGVDDIATQVSIARDKAGIAPDEEVLLYRFLVERHE